MDELRSTVDGIFRRESGRIIAGLIRVSQSFDLAEEAMQDAFAAALTHWGNGLPDNPAAWITAVARRKLIDYSRRERTRNDKQDQLLYETETSTSEADPIAEAEMDFPDDRLRLIFTCCHPALNVEAQVALTLRTLGGLSPPWRNASSGRSARSRMRKFPTRFRHHVNCRNVWHRCRRSSI